MRKKYATCSLCMFYVLYLYGFAWLIIGILVENMYDESKGNLSGWILCFLRKMPPSLVIASYSICNLFLSATGCMLFEYNLEKLDYENLQQCMCYKHIGCFDFYKIFSIIVGIYQIVSCSLYVTWPVLTVTTVIYLLLAIYIFNIPVDYSGDKTHTSPLLTTEETPFGTLHSIPEDE